MGRFNDEMIRAGVLVAAEGIDDAAKCVFVGYSLQPPVVTDGPYGETKELFGGFWILAVAYLEAAVEWAKQAPMAGPGSKAEIRRVASIDEFPQVNEWIQKEQAWREATGQLRAVRGIGRASGRGRGWISGVAVSLKKKRELRRMGLR